MSDGPPGAARPAGFFRVMSGTKGPFREYLRKWVVIAGSIGLVTGAAAMLLDIIIREVLLGGALEGSPVGYILPVYDSSPAFAFLLPFAGMVGVGLLLRKFASDPLLTGTEEVLDHYHYNRTPLKVREGLVKYLGAIITIGFGGSAGLEGPSINAGAVIGSWVWSKFGGRLSLSREDLRIMLLAGASAGIAAIFKAPLTGIVFALEVPYKDDIARKAFLPSIISGVVSYLTFASVEGFQPLFSFTASATFGFTALALSALVGVMLAFVAMGFAKMFHALERLYTRKRLPLMARFTIGGLAVGVIALVVRMEYARPYTYGPGYYLIDGSLLGTFSIQFLLAILILRLLATTFTLGSGGIGGIFFPQVVFGAMIGSLFALVTHGDVTVYASVGIAAFMSAGYKTPLAAVTFVGDTTGNVSYLIPAMIASAVAYVISGENTVSSRQRLREEVQLSELLGITAGAVMPVRRSPLSSDSSVEDTIQEALDLRATEIVVVDDGAPRMISLEDAITVPPEERKTRKAGELPFRVAPVVSESDSLDRVMHFMHENRVNTVAVAGRGSNHVVGTLSTNNILDYIDFRRVVEGESRAA